jgi:hypothetical protein
LSSSIFYRDDTVRACGKGGTVSDDDQGSSTHGVAEIGGDQEFGLSIEG